MGERQSDDTLRRDGKHGWVGERRGSRHLWERVDCRRGWRLQHDLLPCYWRNGTLAFLPTGAGAQSYGYTNGAAVDTSGNVYIVGDTETSASQTPCYWRNGVLTLLPQATPTPFMEGRRVLTPAR